MSRRLAAKAATGRASVGQGALLDLHHLLDQVEDLVIVFLETSETDRDGLGPGPAFAGDGQVPV